MNDPNIQAALRQAQMMNGGYRVVKMQQQCGNVAQLCQQRQQAHRPKYLQQKPLDPNFTYVQAVYAYRAKDAKQISYPAGAMIKLIHTGNNVWGYGCWTMAEGKVGFFPKATARLFQKGNAPVQPQGPGPQGQQALHDAPPAFQEEAEEERIRKAADEAAAKMVADMEEKFAAEQQAMQEFKDADAKADAERERLIAQLQQQLMEVQTKANDEAEAVNKAQLDEFKSEISPADFQNMLQDYEQQKAIRQQAVHDAVNAQTSALNKKLAARKAAKLKAQQSSGAQ